MKTQSAKAKGRKLQQWVRDLILETWNELEPDDVRSTSMGAGGEDLQLSPAARRKFGYSVECKNVEKLNVWGAEQAITTTRASPSYEEEPQETVRCNDAEAFGTC